MTGTNQPRRQAFEDSLPESLKILLAHGDSTTSLTPRKALSALAADVLTDRLTEADPVKQAHESPSDRIISEDDPI